jgi:hypothetical protein
MLHLVKISKRTKSTTMKAKILSLSKHAKAAGLTDSAIGQTYNVGSIEQSGVLISIGGEQMLFMLQDVKILNAQKRWKEAEKEGNDFEALLIKKNMVLTAQTEKQ